MDLDLLKIERKQLVACWSTFVRNPTWRQRLEGKVQQYTAAKNNPLGRRAQPREILRQFHNELGYRAEEKKNGLCSGAIFRTTSFINNTQRIGRRAEQTVHIEHTVPIAVLDKEISLQKVSSKIEIVAFLLNHSVVTAFDISEKATAISSGYSSKTDAFNKSSPDFDRPFKRYRPLFEKSGAVWNVFDCVPIDPDDFSFEHHATTLTRLINHCASDIREI